LGGVQTGHIPDRLDSLSVDSEQWSIRPRSFDHSYCAPVAGYSPQRAERKSCYSLGSKCGTLKSCLDTNQTFAEMVLQSCHP